MLKWFSRTEKVPKHKSYRIIKTTRGYLAQFKLNESSDWMSIYRYHLDKSKIFTERDAFIVEEYSYEFYTSKEDCKKRIAEHISKMAFKKVSKHIHDEEFINKKPIESVIVNVYERTGEFNK
jgi:hypothetical protein